MTARKAPEPYLLESQIENWVVDKAAAMGVPSLKLNVRGRRDFPDRIFWIPGGKPLLIEFKRPGAEPSRSQEVNHKMLKFRGYNVQVHDNRAKALTAITTAAMEAQALSAQGGKIPVGERSSCAVLGPRLR